MFKPNLFSFQKKFPFEILFFSKSQKTPVQLLQYAVVGGVSVLVDTGIFLLCIAFFNTHYILAQTFAFFGGIIVNYSLSTAWVFERQRKFVEETILFLGTGIIGLFISYIMLWFFIDVLNIVGYKNLIAKFLTILITFFWHFWSRKFIVFYKRNI